MTNISKSRHVYFAFHYQRDIWRVNVVRKHKIVKDNYEATGYYDESLWEKAKTQGKTHLKRTIDNGLNGSSVTCVLIGKETFQRHWVDYEIFRSIELGMGVFGVFINDLKDQNRHSDTRGPNPFEFLRYSTSSNGSTTLVPQGLYESGWKDYSDGNIISATAAPYLRPNSTNQLSGLFSVYNWVSDRGDSNFSDWADQAARQAGR